MIFQNTQNLPNPIVFLRVYKISPGALVSLRMDYDESLKVSIPVIVVDGADPDAIQAILTFPISEEEIEGLARLNSAKELARAIPNWATFTREEAETWYTDNVRNPFTAATTLAAVKLVIGTMINVLWRIIQMELALRDQIWPDLPD